MKSRKHLTTLATTAVLLGISSAAAGGAQATTNTPAQLEESTDVFDSAPETSTPAIGVKFIVEQPLSPVSQQNAVRAAEDYLDVSAFSRQGLIEQLEYSGFSTEDATFAVDQIAVDWNVQAAKAAEDYLDISGFSRSGLIEQLEYSGFTPAQAEYGATAVGY
jgi:hypothetical protein